MMGQLYMLLLCIGSFSRQLSPLTSSNVAFDLSDLEIERVEVDAKRSKRFSRIHLIGPERTVLEAESLDLTVCCLRYPQSDT